MASVNRCFYDISRSFRVISLMAIWRYWSKPWFQGKKAQVSIPW
jgi:hypothetical protein